MEAGLASSDSLLVVGFLTCNFRAFTMFNNPASCLPGFLDVTILYVYCLD